MNNETSPNEAFDFSGSGWQRLYDENRTGWDRGEASPALRRWLDDGLLSVCRIFVPGCGRGHEVMELAERGFDVTAADFAAAPVESLRERLSGRGLTANVLQADVLTFQPGEIFDVIYEQTCLCAISPDMRSVYEQRIHECLTTGGQLFALFMQIEPSHEAFERPGPPFHCDINEMRQLFSTDRWEWPTDQIDVEHSLGLYEAGFILRRKER